MLDTRLPQTSHDLQDKCWKTKQESQRILEQAYTYLNCVKKHIVPLDGTWISERGTNYATTQHTLPPHTTLDSGLCRGEWVQTESMCIVRRTPLEETSGQHTTLLDQTHHLCAKGTTLCTHSHEWKSKLSWIVWSNINGSHYQKALIST